MKTLTFTLRISEEENMAYKKMARELGMSLNSFMLLAAKTFQLSYGDLINQNQDQFLRFLSHNRLPTS